MKSITIISYFKQIRKKLWVELILLVKEKSFEGRLKYLYFSKKKDSLLILFPGFSKDKPRKYNYLLSLIKTKKYDLLYVNDNFGYMGSYNLFENGSNYPEILTTRLIDVIIEMGKYKNLHFAGSSKGGTCALYFGIKYHATEIYAGACQFYIGDYVGWGIDPKVFKGMMGCDIETSKITMLNNIIPDCIEKINGIPPRITILCSKQDSTYNNHIIPLLNFLESKDIPYDFIESNYERHSEVGNDFSSLLRNRFLLN